jgi:hypothetical protein
MSTLRWRAGGLCLGAAIILLVCALPLSARQDEGGSPETSADPAVTMFPHSQTARWWVSGQDNIISQWHPSFDAKFSGPNSLKTHREHATSNIGTLFTGVQLTATTEIFMHFEMADGGGISDALGLGGFTDLDVVRNPTLGTTPYIARGMIRQIIPLSRETVEAERGPWYLATKVPVRRLEFRFGKMGVNDFFDINDVGTDSHLQFMNWTVDNNGAYDYAADTRGYTVGLLAEYHDRELGVSVRRSVDAEGGQWHRSAMEFAPRASRELRTRTASEDRRTAKHDSAPANVREPREHGRVSRRHS